MSSILSKYFTVAQAGDGMDALDMIYRHPPSIVVTDVMMPRLDGRGLMKAIRENASISGMPFILVSAQAGIEARAEGLESGADDYIVKPFQSRELVARVHKHLQQARMRRELENHVQQRTRELVESELRYKDLADRYAARAATAEEQQKHLEAFIDLFSHELRNRMFLDCPTRYFEAHSCHIQR